MCKEDVTISSWDGFISEAKDLDPKDGWVFRGQKSLENHWTLKSQLEAVADRYLIKNDKLPQIEQGLIREFKRHIHHYLTSLPDDDDWMEWLSLMQHYGAPTRLVDATYSIFVALFFAIARTKIDENGSVELWAFNVKKIASVFDTFWPRNKEKRILHYKGKSYHNYESYKVAMTLILRCPIPFVRGINSFRQNERQKIQQGLFLTPTDVSLSFNENLKCMVQRTGNDSIRKIRVICSENFFKEAVPSLRRMNITSSSLFPGLSGFSESLQMQMYMAESIFSSWDNYPRPRLKKAKYKTLHNPYKAPKVKGQRYP